ncbi:G protein-coupled glucose receptor regulating Gpa2-domain-containing protein [Diplogelasinospora grovesii]|uniref:G protein-coupled glucose receptor regulating Gpa2-domain-containing protein n=1 Tax=Diplogelasinospora grovesii TaxID=303347 RepID=A0AAN6S151_9PEZI|nr:G protein-coupled glucose receptor regulating Gpa2-domain-containing protein [Diplogelasinospora grovesii]
MTLTTISQTKNIYDSEDASGSVAPLPPVLMNGLAAVSTFGFLSFFSTLWLFCYLTYKFIVWNAQPFPLEQKRATSPEPQSPTTSDVNGFLVPDSLYLCPQKGSSEQRETTCKDETFLQRLRKNPPNQFLVLIYNLLFADIQQAMAFLLNVTWLARDSVDVGTAACWTQGWFVSTGDLASSVFISAIAVHTYLGVVRGYRLPTWIFYSAIACMWAFVYGMALLGVIITRNGEGHGGLYVRAGAWCWINSAFQDLRLYLHYLWIFLSLALTTIVYLVIYFHLQIHSKHSSSCCLASGSGSRSLPGEHYPNLDPNSPSFTAPSSPRSTITDMSIKRLQPIPTSARHPTFLLYPLIYVLCTAPLAAGRIASMAGNNVPLSYFCFAGAMIASAGWLDVALYSSTRRSIVFSGDAPPSQDTGLETFAFMRTPAGRNFGNVVYVSGGVPEEKRRRWNSSKTWVKTSAGARLRTALAGATGSGNSSRNGSKVTLGSMQSLGMGNGEVWGTAIQCETTTSVVVEIAPVAATDGDSSSSSSSSRKGSVTSSTKEVR